MQILVIISGTLSVVRIFHTYQKNTSSSFKQISRRLSIFHYFAIGAELNLNNIPSSRSSTSNTSIYRCCLLRHCSFFASGDPVPLPTVLEEESSAEPTILSVDPVPEQLNSLLSNLNDHSNVTTGMTR